MDGKQGIEIRESITKAIDNFVSYNEGTYSYDRTYIGRIILVNSDGTYNVQINRAKYYNLKSENGFVYSKNDIVKCIAPQNNLNLLYIASGTKNQNDVNQNIFGIKNFVNGIKLNGLQINGVEASSVDLNTIIQAGFYGISNGINTPTSAGYGELIVFGYRTLNNWIAQLFIVQGDDISQPNYAYLRSCTSVNGGSWTEWKLLSFADASNIVPSNWINILLSGEAGYGDTIQSKLLAQNGYVRYKSGLIIQWGYTSQGGGTGTNVLFPISFTTTNYSVVGNMIRDSRTTNGWNYINNKTVSGFYCVNGTDYANWIAIGY